MKHRSETTTWLLVLCCVFIGAQAKLSNTVFSPRSSRHNTTNLGSSYARIKGGFTGISTRRSRKTIMSKRRFFTTPHHNPKPLNSRKIVAPSMTASGTAMPLPRRTNYNGITPASKEGESPFEVVNGDVEATLKESFKKEHKKKALKLPRKLDMALFTAYFCNAIVFTLPVMLLPMVAAERQAGVSIAGFCATVASVASLGGAVGKFLNGFVCQEAGGRRSGGIYLVGLGAFLGLLSASKNSMGASTIGLIVAGMEFCCSIQWTACTVVLANHYDKDPEKFASGITGLSFASTSGTLLTKFIGTALLQRFHWRRVAQFGTLVAMLGALCMRTLVQEYPEAIRKRNARRNKKKRSSLDIKGIKDSLRTVLSSRLFWAVGMAHAMAFLARTSDRVLGTFFLEATQLPRYICGGLTASVTLGFLHGLTSGSAFHKLKDVAEKSRLLKRRYWSSVVSALGLAVCANKSVGSLFANKSVLAAVVALVSGAMASNLSFQFYHLPPTVAKSFGKNKAVCLSFLDGMGWFFAAPVWALTSRIVSHPSLGTHGWSLAWTMLAFCFAAGGKIMMEAIPPVLKSEQAKAAA